VRGFTKTVSAAPISFSVGIELQIDVLLKIGDVGIGHGENSRDNEVRARKAIGSMGVKPSRRSQVRQYPSQPSVARYRGGERPDEDAGDR
jgi:hypothetical protein